MTELELIENILEELMPYVRKRRLEKDTLGIQSKEHANDLLTEVDLETQRRIVEKIQAVFPDDCIVGEEEEFSKFPEDPNVRCWIIDPIDGTSNFIRCIFPEYGISIAFAEGGQPVAGGIGFPGLGDVFLAQRGEGATRNGKPLQVTNAAEIGLARVEVDFGRTPTRQATMDQAGEVIVKAGQFRCHCSAVVGLCSVATGDCDAFVHTSLPPWDYAAGMVIVEEAGGRSSDFRGNPISLFGDNPGILVTNGSVHDDLLRHLTP